MKKTDRYAKTIVFCVDQEHALEMRRALNNLNTDLTKQYPQYVCRVTSDEGTIGRGHLSRFQELETISPVILTTSKLLTTGIDAPMVKNVAIARVVNAITEFKQIIGRGTRVRDDYDKYFFNILDYTGSATRHFADTDFDGHPEMISEETIDLEGKIIHEEVISQEKEEKDLEDYAVAVDPVPPEITEPPPAEPRKYYVDNGMVEIAAQLVYELDDKGKQLRVVKYSDYTAEVIRTLYPTATLLREHWTRPDERNEIMTMLAGRGINFSELAEATKQPNADPFDLLCHLAYNAPLFTRYERVRRLRKDKQDFFDRYSPEARAVLEDLLDKYSEHGITELNIPEALKVPPISDRGNITEIISFFGNAESLREAVVEMQIELYAA
jgi:type I restriction enzyme R subunit